MLSVYVGYEGYKDQKQNITRKKNGTGRWKEINEQINEQVEVLVVFK